MLKEAEVGKPGGLESGLGKMESELQITFCCGSNRLFAHCQPDDESAKHEPDRSIASLTPVLISNRTRNKILAIVGNRPRNTAHGKDVDADAAIEATREGTDFLARRTWG